jgi:signal transduction histidine kinase
VELSEAEARGYLGKVAPGPHVLVTVSDTGSGIKPEVRRRLFVEPFFTTKVRHRGLGLAIVCRTLCTHRGGIQIDSVSPPGSGTCVRIALPLSPGRAPVLTPPPCDTRPRGVGSGEYKNAITVGG